MTDATKIRVARKGKDLGEFSLAELSQKWVEGAVVMSDDYWRPGMRAWGKLQDIREEILSAGSPPSAAGAQRSETTTGSPTPPAPAGKTPQAEAGAGRAFGSIVFIIGAITLLSALTGDATGSAIRQSVLAQHMTNGILLMILGTLLTRL
jgi:hypothetical protein